jgi:hypothetical protein
MKEEEDEAGYRDDLGREERGEREAGVAIGRVVKIYADQEEDDERNRAQLIKWRVPRVIG